MVDWEESPLNTPTKAPRKKRLSKLSALLAFDRKQLALACQEHHCEFTGILGIDEVGRGSLVGPVVAAALVFPSRLSPADKRLLADLDDSKAAHLNHAKRLAMASHLQTIGHWGIGEASLEDIERYNIFHASFLAGRRAIAAVAETLGTEMQAELERYIVIVDGKHRISELTLIQYPHVKADGKSAAVAGASIIAKAYRDNLLMRYAEEYPGYGWEKNAGYGTPSHQEAMQTLGLTPLHRKSFKLVQQQLTLF